MFKQKRLHALRHAKLRVSGGAVLLIAVLYFFDDSGILSAFVPAVAVHEAGHVIALSALGTGISRIDVTASGLRLDYTWNLDMWEEFIAAVAGPLFGGVFAYTASVAGNLLESEYLRCTAGVSLALSLFNLLPALPLDGGRCLRTVLNAISPKHADAVLFATTALTAFSMLTSGFWLLSHGYGAALIPAAMWIILSLATGSV